MPIQFVMPECFYRASSVFCVTEKNTKTLDSRLKNCGNDNVKVFLICVSTVLRPLINVSVQTIAYTRFGKNIGGSVWIGFYFISQITYRHP